MKRTASARWQGTIKEGQGRLGTQSGVLRETPYTFLSRFGDAPETNPEELIGAAHAGCFTMALALFLGNAGFTAETLETTATVSLEQIEGKFAITAIHLDLRGVVPGIDQGRFQAVAEEAKVNCPVSQLFKAPITLTATLEG